MLRVDRAVGDTELGQFQEIELAREYSDGHSAIAVE